jgi:phosphatidylinositol kinase/protein kinase (PI-3  family)
MHPLDTKSCLKRSMQHVLRALRNNKDVLLHIMDVFASDPLVEWSRPSSSTEGDDGATPQSRRKQAHSTGKHNPLSRIQSALRKLNGDHPSHIMCADIDESVHPSLEKSKNLMKQIVLERCFA